VACARTFSQVLPLISTRYMLGLSATPTRTDRMECMLEWFFRGVNVGYQLEKQPIELDFIRNETYIKPRFVKRNGEKVLLRHLLLEHLIERNEARTNQAVQRIVDEVPRGHHVIVFSETLLGVEAVYNKLLEARDVHGVLPADCTVGMFRAGMKKVDRARVQQCRIIVATYKMCEKGFNVPRLSMAVLLTPRPGKALQQIIGRITRICPGKPTPLVIDFIDLQPGSVRPANATGTMYPELAGLFYSRMRHYKGGMYECRTLSAPNDMPAEETAAVATVPATETAFKVVSKRNEFIQLSDAE
jgi:superfamily II DNA or RNA helicase